MWLKKISMFCLHCKSAHINRHGIYAIWVNSILEEYKGIWVCIKANVMSHYARAKLRMEISDTKNVLADHFFLTTSGKTEIRFNHSLKHERRSHIMSGIFPILRWTLSTDKL